ncbi:MAG: response regulator transcription factor [Lautropia sp.]
MKTLLIVEDQEDVRELIKITLEEDGYEIHEADNADAALAVARDLRPALMLLDVMMPGSIDGLQLCRRVRADPRLSGAKIVMLTARAQASDRADALAAGADAYLSKPFSPLELETVVRRLAS